MTPGQGTAKPRQGFAGLWNISFGFFGIQAGFALQNANMSRIFQSLGTDIDNLAFLWIAAPLTGLIVQPLIGYLSDRTWTRLGRRRPFFLGGAVLATLSLVAMPNANVLLAAAVLLWLLDASLNISMEPFRAFVGDMLDSSQHTAGYAFQTAFIGAGAVVGSLTPLVLTNVFHVANTAAPGVVPPSVHMAFYIGAAALFVCVLWTVVTTREYPPEQMAGFAGAADADDDRPLAIPRSGPWWLAAGVAIIVAVGALGLDKPVYVLGGMLTAFGLMQIVSRMQVANGQGGAMARIVSDLAAMPAAMGSLVPVQFFSWSALFIMWIYTTPIVARRFYGATDAASAAYNAGADHVGELFAIYNGVAALFALVLPALAGRVGVRAAHAIGLAAGGLGFLLYLVAPGVDWLILAEVLIGIAWASILTMPYAILARALPPAKTGVYMGLFNIFIVVPQLVVSSLMGAFLHAVSPSNPVPAMAVAAASLGLAALLTLRIRAAA